MKDLIKHACLIGASLFLIPVLMIYASGYEKGSALAQITQNKEETQETTLLDESLIIPILAKEISYTYEYETIKAQAVVIRTYMARRALGIQTTGELVGYTEEEMKELWKEDYESIYKTYEEAVEDTKDEIIWYNNQPIQALYHKASGECTRSANDVYNIEIPYLISVSNEKVLGSTQIKMSKKEVAETLKQNYNDIIIDDEHLENQIQIIEKDKAGYIKSIQIGNLILEGEKFRDVLGIPSSNFKIYLAGNDLIFDVVGSGLGIGLSQDGANEMVKQGKDYKEVIEYYYTGVDVKAYGEINN